MRTIVACCAVAALSALSVRPEAVLAHQQRTTDLTLPENATGMRGFYHWEASTSGATFWEESNGKDDAGMFGGKIQVDSEDADEAKPRAVLGLQIHHVCYGTFTPACDWATGCEVDCADVGPGPDCLNCHHGRDRLFSYLPWGYFAQGVWVDGSAADCAAWGGTFVPKDRLVHPSSGFGDNDELLVTHGGIPASQCFPPGYGQVPPAPAGAE